VPSETPSGVDWGCRMILDVLGAMVAMAAMDRRGHIVYTSARWCEMTGWPRVDAVGRHWTEYVHPDDVVAARSAGREAVRSASPVTYESRVISRDGSATTWVRSSVAPTTDAAGTVTGWLLTAIDVTERRRAEEGLRLSEERLRVMFDRSPDVMTILEADGTWRATSAPLWRDLEIGEEMMASGEWWGVVHPDDREASQRALAMLIERTDDLSGLRHELRLVSPDGRVRWVETAGVNLSSEPAVRGIVLHSRDVTERHLVSDELRAVNARLSALIDALHLGVHVSDEHGKAIAVNRAFFETLGIDAPADELVGVGVVDRRGCFRTVWAHPAATLAKLGKIAAGGNRVVDTRLELADGRILSVDFVPIESGGAGLGHVWLVRDVTEEEAVAAEREHLLDMEREQNFRLTELDALKTGLIASVSHELRTPLTSIVSFTQLLRAGLGTDSAADQAEFLTIIGRNTERLQRMVDDLLLLDRIESNTLQVSSGPVDMGKLVGLAISSIRPAAEKKGVRLEVETADGPALRGDGDRLGQLIDNLLVNAVRFTPSGGTVTVRAHQLGEGWQVEVADTGIGIPAGERDRVFERFFRASNARQQAVPGSGLGLAIVREVADLHRGRVEVAGNGEAGTVFTVVLRGVANPPAGRTPSPGAMLGESVP